MPNRPPEPPRLARALLHAVLPAEEEGAVLGDLLEEYRGWARPQRGRFGADAWYWRQVLTSIGPTLVRRRRRRRAHSTETMTMDALRIELKHALRALAARPLHSGLAMLTLALGVGGTAVVASVAQQALLRPLPYPDDHELVAFWGSLDWSTAEFAHLRDGYVDLGAVAAWRPDEATLRTGDAPARVAQTVRASAELFAALGVSPARGRTFEPGDDVAGADPVAVVSHGFWLRELGGGVDALGRRIGLDGMQRTVVGVMPPDFYFPDPSVEIWVPLEVDPENRAGMLSLIGRSPRAAEPVGLAPELDRITRSLGEAFDYPEEWDRTNGATFTPLRTTLRGDPGSTLMLVGGAMLLLLLAACVNVAALTVARTHARVGDLAVRAALGAGRGRIALELVLESMLLSLGGAAAGGAIAALGYSFIGASLPATPGAPPAVDGGLFLFALLIAVASGLAVGVAPALSVLRGRLGHAITAARGSGAVGRARLASGLVVVEVTLAVLLVTGAGLLLRSVRALAAIDPGFEVENLLAFDVVMGDGNFDLDGRVRTLDALVERAVSLPGVEAAGGTQKLPLRGNGWTTGYRVEDRPDERLFSAFRTVSHGYLEALGARLVAGRLPRATDDADSEPVVVVNQTLARELWPAESPLGKRVTSGFTGTWATVIGVVEDVRVYGLTDEGVGTRYQLYAQAGVAPEGNTLVVRTSGASPAVVEAVRSAIHAVDPGIAIAGVSSMESLFRDAMGRVAEIVLLLTLLGALALALGSVGVYGVVAHYVGQRTREWGVRLALGQGPGAVARLIVRRGLGLVVLGVAAGVVFALLGSRVLSALLYEVGPHDPVAFGGAVLLLVGAGVLAASIPALRASRTDPVESLRAE